MTRRPWWSPILACLACAACQSPPEAAVREVPDVAAPPPILEIAVGDPRSGPAILAVDEVDSVWVAVAKAGRLVRLANGAVTSWDIGADSRPVGVAPAGSGVLWIAASFDNKLIRFDANTGERREFALEDSEAWPFNIAVGPDGRVWFTQRMASRVGCLDPSTAEIRHFVTPTPGSGPAGLAVDPRSGTVWFTESYADRVGRLDPDTGAIHEIVLGDRSTGMTSGPAGLALDAEGGVWFAKLEGKLGHLAPGSERAELIDLPAEARRPAGIAVGPAGTVWAAALDGNLLIRHRPGTDGVDLYPLPTGAPDESPAHPPLARTSRPFGIDVDSAGHVWFSEQYTGQIGVLDQAPPAVAILSPAGEIGWDHPLLTVQALDAVSGVGRPEVTLDGTPVAPERGRLSLVGLEPGPHTVEVRVADHAGNVGSATSTFVYARPAGEAPARVQLLDAPPFFAPASVQVTEGDEVQWWYEASSDGHTLTSTLHRVVIEGPGAPVSSPRLRGGEQFSYRFAEPGLFAVRDEEHEGATLRVEVLPR